MTANQRRHLSSSRSDDASYSEHGQFKLTDASTDLGGVVFPRKELRRSIVILLSLLLVFSAAVGSLTPYAQKVFGELLRQAIAEAEAMFDHPLKQYALFKDFEEQVTSRQPPGTPDLLADKPHARAYFGVLRLVLGDGAVEAMDDATRQTLVAQALEIDEVVRTAVAENSLSPQSIEAAIRKGLLPLLFGKLGLDRAKEAVEQIVQITRLGLGKAQ